MKPQDILVVLKIQSLHDREAGMPSAEIARLQFTNAFAGSRVPGHKSVGGLVWSQRLLAEETVLSLSEVNSACRRLAGVGLLTPESRKVVRSSLLEFLVHGLKYVFPATMGKASRGMPTGYAADPLREMFLTSANEPPPVWPDVDGTVRGMALKPLYQSVPIAAKKDKTLYEYLVLVDAIRAGRARERSMAIEILQKRLG